MNWPTLYEVLDVGPRTPRAQLVAARDRAPSALPADWLPRACAALRGRAALRIEHACRVLADPARRARYDRDLWLARIVREARFH